MERLYFEEIDTGWTLCGDTVCMERDEMVEFASRWDNQPMHVDPTAAAAMGFEDVIATSVLTFAAMSRSINSIYRRVHFLPSGIDVRMDFLKPVFAGDELTASVSIISKRPSRKKGRGVVTIECEMLDQLGEAVLRLKTIWLVRTRPQSC